jgi:hypothetical protein
VVLIANVTRVPEAVLLACFYSALAGTLVSGVDYVRRAAGQLERLHGSSTGGTESHDEEER